MLIKIPDRTNRARLGLPQGAWVRIDVAPDSLKSAPYGKKERAVNLKKC